MDQARRYSSPDKIHDKISAISPKWSLGFVDHFNMIAPRLGKKTDTFYSLMRGTGLDARHGYGSGSLLRRANIIGSRAIKPGHSGYSTNVT